MPERQSRHSDNDLIDRMKEYDTPSQQSSAGGEVNRNVGSRAELNRALDPDNREPEIGSDNPGQNAKKGEKTRQAIQENRSS
ncbi:hypothetical protein GRI69_01580 [Erythrobacter vulgaris]|uniref:Uncharacterized protein n=1 Tax=Qipengyuania vulgaris TaxID=291985 RepID=A0A844XLR8_9SPHN|nr:hypothetical protein [Qipengyuania vulgaris]MXO46951.1 hypothetical protein [Qipengyuania vulgaris]